jgi:peroxiredoxin
MRHLQELYTKFRDKNLMSLGFNASDDKKIALEMLHENDVTFPNILDSSDAAMKVQFQDYRSSGVPLNYIIDPDGKVVDAWYGYEEGHPRAQAALQKMFLAQRLREVLFGAPQSKSREDPAAK